MELAKLTATRPKAISLGSLNVIVVRSSSATLTSSSTAFAFPALTAGTVDG